MNEKDERVPEICRALLPIDDIINKNTHDSDDLINKKEFLI